MQVPLQPLADNLDSSVYNTFEQDPVKYRRYREAVECAIRDFGESASRPEELVLYVLGAGRGPLVTCSLEAERNYNERFRCKRDRLRLKVFVVEKNSNAIVTLRYMNSKVWRNRCIIIESDMRNIPIIAMENGYPQPDIIVSELLGSFGDNELSPECLDGVTALLKPTTISIPQSYTSYLESILQLMGFAGYFYMDLYKGISLSIVPSTYSKGMISWFPALIPLRELFRVHNGDKVSYSITVLQANN
ncbi:Skb1 methyltransferase, partial [Oesophagostomum dentatum]